MLSTIISPRFWVFFNSFSNFWKADFCSWKFVGFRMIRFFRVCSEELSDIWFILSKEMLPSVSMNIIFLSFFALWQAASVTKFDFPDADGP